MTIKDFKGNQWFHWKCDYDLNKTSDLFKSCYEVDLRLRFCCFSFMNNIEEEIIKRVYISGEVKTIVRVWDLIIKNIWNSNYMVNSV